MDYGNFLKVYECTLSLLGKWNTPNGTINVDTADLLLINKILQFTEKNRKCFLSDTALSEIIGTKDKSSVQKRLQKLERLEIIKRNAFTETVNGKSVSRRELSVLMVSRADLSTNGPQVAPSLTGKEAFFQFMRNEYHVSRIPDGIKEKLETVFNGNYMYEKHYINDRPIPPDELLKLFQYVFYELKLRDKIKAKEAEKGMQGLSQFDYDLTTVIGYYDECINGLKSMKS